MAARSRCGGALLALLLGVACGPPDQGTEELGAEPRSGTLTLGAAAPAEVLPGTRLRVAGTGFPVMNSQTQYRLSFTGHGQDAARGYDIKVDLPARFESATALSVDISEELHQQLGGGALAADGSAMVEGELSLTVTQDRRIFQRSAAARFTVRRQFTPLLSGLSTRAVYLADRVLVRGGGLLLAGEGQSLVVLEGTFATQINAGQDRSQGQFTPYPRREFALSPVSREEAALPIDASVLGIAAGTLDGRITLVNRHKSGVELRTEAVDLQLSLLRTQLGALNSATLSRGQRVVGLGAGFLPLDSGADTATLVRLAGTFTLKAGGPAAPVEITLVAQVLDSNHLQFVARPEIGVDGALAGLGARVGRFVGSVTPVVTRGAQQQTGVPLPCGSTCVIDIVPPKQVLFAKFLANFAEGLRRFGLRNLEAEIRAGALQTARRSYSAWNIEIRDSRPADYDEFTTMEVGGPDPNGAGLFGLDNTEGLDRGNLRLNDYIGGFNAIAEVEGNFAFGGVFIESFLSFAEGSKKRNALAVPEFDAIFGPFVPELGGRAADRAELQGGPRQAQLLEAVRVMGTLIGNTLAHEFGHSLGMAVGVDGSHNIEDLDRELMDAGLNRSFAERAEIGEYRARPSGFAEKHQTYLREILPKP